MATPTDSNGNGNGSKADTTQVTKAPLPPDGNMKVDEAPRPGSEPPTSNTTDEETWFRKAANTSGENKTSDAGVRKILYAVLLILGTLVALAMLLYSCKGVSDLKETAATKADVTKLQTDKADKTDVAKKVDQTAFDSLKGTVDKVVASDTEQTAALEDLKNRAEKNAADIAKLNDGKVSNTEFKTELSKTRWHLTQVERKLETRIVVEKKAKDPMPTENKTSAPVAQQPTRNVTIHRVPVYIDVYKPRSKR